MTVRAKYRCASVTHYSSDPNAARQFTFNAIYDTSTPENARFTKYTPWGELKMSVDNPSVQFEIGTNYYLDFSTAPE